MERRILIVDDEPYNILGLTVQLNQMGFKGIKSLIDKAFNGAEALQMVKAAHQRHNDPPKLYGLIFMDCSMPIMDGYEASDRIRSFLKANNLPQPIIVAITGHTEDQFISKAWRHQIDEVVAKPTDFEILKEIMNDAIEIE